MRTRPRADRALDAGLRAIREQFHVPAGFPPEPCSAAVAGGRSRDPGRTHVDRTDRPFVTLDPAGVDRPRPGVRHRDGPAPTSSCTTPSPTSASSSTTATRSTPRRGGGASPSTCPTSGPGCTRRRCRRARPACCPTARGRPSCSRCASTRPATSRLDGVERAVVHSRAKLAYETVRPADLPAGFARAVAGASRRRGRRGAPRVEFPEQELERRRRPLGAAVRPPARERGPERRHVAGDQPGRRRRAARGPAPACSG